MFEVQKAHDTKARIPMTLDFSGLNFNFLDYIQMLEIVEHTKFIGNLAALQHDHSTSECRWVEVYNPHYVSSTMESLDIPFRGLRK